MLFFDVTLLDYLWRLLVFGTIVVTIHYIFGLALHFKFFNINPTHSKNIWRGLYSQVLLIMAGAAGYLAFDQQATIKCFESFLKHSGSLTITRGLAGFWVISVLLLAAFDLFQTASSIFISKKWKISNDRLLNAHMKAIAAQLGVEAPSVYIQKNNQSPFVYGITNAALVFPENFSSNVQEQTLRSVIAHELIHIRDADTKWNLVNFFLRRVFFFHPLVYFANSAYIDAQEKSADGQAIQCIKISKSDFAKSFFEVIHFYKGHGNLALSAPSTSDFKALKSRMNYLAETSRESGKSSTLLLFAIGILISGTWSAVEAKSSLSGKIKNEAGANMCVQVQHEMALEQLFRAKSADPVRCE